MRTWNRLAPARCRGLAGALLVLALCFLPYGAFGQAGSAADIASAAGADGGAGFLATPLVSLVNDIQFWTGAFLLALLVVVVWLHAGNIRRRHDAERVLRENEKRFRRYFEVDLVGMAMTSAEMAWLDVNDRMCAMLGYSRDELLQTTWASLTYPQDLPGDLAQFRRLATGEIDGYSLDKRFVRKDGSIIYALLSVQGFWRCDGSLDHVVVMVQDITDRKRAERELALNRERLREAMRIGGLGGWEWQVGSGALIWSEQLVRMAGHDPETFQPSLRHFLDTLHVEDRPRVLRAIERSLRGQKDYRVEFRSILPDGSVRFFAVQGEMSYDGEGRPVSMVGMTLDITERRRAAEALEKRRLQLAEAQRLAHLGSWELDVRTGRMSWSTELYRLLGVAPEEDASQEIFLSRLHPEDRGRIVHLLERSRDGHGTWSAEYRIVRPDGEVRHMAVQTETSFDDGGRPLWILGATLDITERKRAAEESHLNESRLEAALALHRMADAPIDKICRFALESAAKLTRSKVGFLNFGDDPQSAMQGVFWTRETCRQCGLSRLPDRMPLAGTEYSRKVVRIGKALLSNDADRTDNEGWPPVWGGIDLKRHLYVPLIERGAVVAIVGVGNKDEDYNATDIRQMTLLMQVVWRLLQRKIAQRDLEQALVEAEESRDRINALIRSVGDGLIVTDEQRHVVLLNPAAERLLGVRACDVLRQPVDGLVEDVCFQSRFQDLEDVENGQPFYFELRRPRDAVPRYFRGRISAVREKQGKGREHVTSLQDVTRERELDRMKTEFISTAAHELRTPMTSILGFAELLLQRNDLPDGQQRELLGIIHEKTYLLSQIVNDLLDMSRIEAGRGISLKCALCDVNQVLDGWVRGLQQEGPRHQVVVKLPEQPVMLMVDHGKIIQVLENLFSNASKFSPPGSRIWLTGRVINGAFHVAIRDEGIGMTDQQAARMFDKFYRADMSNTARPGLGLGMSIVKNIIEAHGGRMRVESEVGVGTEVGFFLPPLV